MEIITLLKASFSPLVRTGQDPIILMGRRNWRNYITVYRNGSAVYIYIYTSDRPTFNKITPLSFPSSLQRAISVIDNESRVNYECIIIHLREELVKKGFRHDYEIQSARLKWPIAANYRRLNHFLPLPILPIPVSLIYPCIYGVQRVLVFFLPISNLVG